MILKVKYLIYFLIIYTNTINAQTSQWEFMGLAGEEIYDIAIDDSGNVYVGSEGGVFKTTNNGSDWIFQNNGLIIQNVNKFFIDYEGNIYIAASGASNTGCGLYKSTDGGEYWNKIADTLNNRPTNVFYDVKIDPNEPGGIIYVSNYYGVYRSTDNGITWQSTSFTDPGARNIGKNINGYMFFGNDFASWFGLYRSTNLGLNWERHTFLGVSAMVYLRDGSILAGCYDPGLGSFGMYKTTNNGDTWFNTNTFSGLSSPWDFTLDKNEDIYAAFVGAIFLSTNNGTSWIDYGLTGPPTTCIAIDSNGYVWAGAHQDGVYRTAGRTVPVELASFSAEVNGNNVLLKWITATEINNQGFQVERQKAQKDRNDYWEIIGFVNGNGTTSELQLYSYTDTEVLSGNYQYRLKQIDYDGSFEYSNIIEVEVRIPSEFFLSQNYPNPFNPSTQIKYSIKKAGLVQLRVYDILGKEIATLVNTNKEAGNYSIEFNANQLPSGIYIYRMQSGSFVSSKKMILLK